MLIYLFVFLCLFNMILLHWIHCIHFDSIHIQQTIFVRSFERHIISAKFLKSESFKLFLKTDSLIRRTQLIDLYSVSIFKVSLYVVNATRKIFVYLLPVVCDANHNNAPTEIFPLFTFISRWEMQLPFYR